MLMQIILPLTLTLTSNAFAFTPTEVTLAEVTPADVCWKDAIGRGVGKVISACDASKNLVKSGALCYPRCKNDTVPTYYGVGPVCWQHCSKGWVDEGALCRKKGSIETIAKRSYGRGAGYPLTCAAGLQEDAALCYPYCKTGFYGVGPVCWESCAAPLAVTGGAVCCTNGTVCSQKVKDLAVGIPLAVAAALLSGGNATKIEEAVIEALDSLLGFIMPKCDNLNVKASSSVTSSTSPSVLVPALLSTAADTAAPNAQCHSISKRVTDHWCNINCNHNPSFCPPFFCVCTGAVCYHNNDAPDHKCYEACSTGAPFYMKGITTGGRCDSKVYNIQDSETSVYQCPDGITNTKYCAKTALNITVATYGEHN